MIGKKQTNYLGVTMTEFSDKYNTWHKRFSYIKSGIRIVSFIPLIINPTMTALMIMAVGMVAAEIVGVLEEWI